MELLTSEQREIMLDNGRKSIIINDFDPMPVVKLVAPWKKATWLLTELYPSDTNLAFGLCDLGVGCAGLGSVHLSELHELCGPDGGRVERDPHFVPNHSLIWYAERALEAGCIVY